VKINSQNKKNKMKKNLSYIVTAVTLMSLPNLNFAQAPNLGSTAKFAIFSTNGSISNTGISRITGNVGTNNGTSTAFGNVNGGMHDNDGVTALAAADLLVAYNQLNTAVPSNFPSPSLGNGQVLFPGIYSISGNTTINLNLVLNANGNSNAVFIFQIQGLLSTNASARVILTNGAQACNVFWKVEGAVSMAANSTIRGTIIANNAAINISTGDTLEGRALTTAGAVSVNGLLAYTPLGCGAPVLNGPVAPTLASAACYALFSSDGSVTNTGATFVTGDVGTNVGLTTGFSTVNVTGTVHPVPDASTGACATDLGNAYTYLNSLPSDIELLYPAQFGKNLVLTPHTYVMNAATVLSDTLFLNAQGNVDAVFVIQVNGAFSAAANAKVILINGTQSKNVFWRINGAVDLNDNSVFKGTIVCDGAVNLKTGVAMDGRALTITGTFNTASVTAIMPAGCGSLPSGINAYVNNTAHAVNIYPNPFTTSINIVIDQSAQLNKGELKLYNGIGEEVMNVMISKKLTSLERSELPSGIYFYKIISDNKMIQSGKLIAQ